MKRPGLFVVKGILETVDSSLGHRVRFDELAECTPALRNRTAMSQYLKLLLDFGWLTREESETQVSAPAYLRRKAKTLSYYKITKKGKAFLALFPSMGTEFDTEDVAV